MALEDLKSEYGPTNSRTQRGTGTMLGANTTPMDNAQFGNPTVAGRRNPTIFNNLEAAAHNSLYGPFNMPNNPGTGLRPDLLGNDPNTPEIDFTNYRP